jgi:two-component system response regulator CpxR
MNRILMIDDDVELCELLTDYLSQEGFTVDSINDPLVGVETALAGQHDLIVLDVMMPVLNGFEVLRRIRASSGIPVLMLTARGDDVDRIVGLEIGADDYLPKPFNSRELVARIRAVLRRSEQQSTLPPRSPGSIKVADIALNSASRTVERSGQKVELTSIEFSILEVLMGLAGQVIHRDDLVRKSLGRENSAYDRSIDVHISSLRRKLGVAQDGAERIKTIRNIGYLYSAG